MKSQHLPFFLAPEFLRLTGLSALAALTLELLFLPRLVDIDSAVWHAILFWRGCGTDQAVNRVVRMATVGAATLLAAAVVVSARRSGLRTTWPPLAVCVVGLYVGKVMKNAFARERPSMLPDVALGHSFPSGHVMNTAIAVLAVIVLAAGFRHRRRWWAAGTVLLAVVFAGRVLVAHHWLLDAVGGVLAALAVTGICLPPFGRRPLLAPAILALSLSVVLAIDFHVRSLAIRLPSPLSARLPATVEVDLGGLLETSRLKGGWEEQMEKLPRSQTWLRGSGTLEIALPAAEVGPLLHNRGPLADSQAELAIAGRPDADLAECVRVGVVVNGLALPTFVAFVGWREYRLPIAPPMLVPGVNEVRIDARDREGKPARLAVRYLRIDTDRKAAGEN